MERNTRKVGLVVGSFDPIHIGHLDLIRKAISAGMDKVLIVPSPQNPWKDEHGANFEHRCKMAEIAILDMFPGQAKVEPGGDPKNLKEFLDIDGKSYSYIQLPKVIEKFGEADYYIVGGTDLGESIKKWKNWDIHLKDFFKLLIVDRLGFSNIDNDLQIKASSTVIREALRRKEDVRPYLLRTVQYYINLHHLYE